LARWTHWWRDQSNSEVTSKEKRGPRTALDSKGENLSAGREEGPLPGGERGSYGDALLRPRTFKPRSRANPHRGWYNERTMGGSGRPSVWSRLQRSGSAHARLRRPPFVVAGMVAFGWRLGAAPR
jgi:hypothetical protein